MTNHIEIFDQRRRKHIRGYLVGFVVFFIVWFLRFILRANDIGTQAAHSVILGILILCVFVQAYFAIHLNITVLKIKKDPKLYSALYNELVRLHELKAWRVAFFCCLGVVVLIALLSLIMPVRDIVFIALTAILAGFGGYQLAFYYLDRN
jgi:heme/copper-type cytochrome/quinol oxidase subunit 4